jgi:hypothetical protein
MTGFGENIIFKFKIRDGKEFPVYESMPLPETQRQAIIKMLREKYGLESERKEADHRYNCHGMVFIGKLGWLDYIRPEKRIIVYPVVNREKNETSNYQTIMDDILRGNGFNRTCRLNNIEIDPLVGNEDIQIGDIAIYRDAREYGEEIQHSAIVVELKKLDNILTDFKVLSKIGPAGEYFHRFRAIPSQFGKIVEIWTDRGPK